jgi:hypothetical protein
MERLGSLAEQFVEDVNKENSSILSLYEDIVHSLFKMILAAGIPFFVYVLLQFTALF